MTPEPSAIDWRRCAFWCVVLVPALFAQIFGTLADDFIDWIRAADRRLAERHRR